MKISRREFLGFAAALGLSSCVHVRVPLISKKPEGPFRVAAINDLHFTNARSAAIVSRAVDKINATEDVRFTAVLGDVSSTGKLSEMSLARQVLDRLAQPYLVIPGNHDVEPGAPDPYGNFNKMFERGNWVREEENWTFIGLDSCTGGASDVSIRPDRIEWLKKQIKHINADRPIGLFTHHPFNPHTKQYRVKNADEVLALFAGHNLKLVASGHYHGNQVEEQNGVLFTTTACCSSTRKNFDDTEIKGYRLFLCEGDRVQTEFVEVMV